MLIPIGQIGYLSSSDAGKTEEGSSKQGFPYTLPLPLLPSILSLPCPISRKLGQLVIHLIFLTVAR